MTSEQGFIVAPNATLEVFSFYRPFLFWVVEAKRSVLVIYEINSGIYRFLEG